MKKLLLLLFSLIVSCVVVVGSVFVFKHLTLQRQVSEVIAADYRNEGIKLTAHYGNYINQKELTVDISGFTEDKRPVDVFRVFLQFAEKLKERDFERIIFASKGEAKFYLKGEDFKALGVEYGEQNPIYTMRTFPEKLYTPDGDAAFSRWTGGVLGVASKQMEDFLEFHRQWYINDLKGTVTD